MGTDANGSTSRGTSRRKPMLSRPEGSGMYVSRRSPTNGRDACGRRDESLRVAPVGAAVVPLGYGSPAPRGRQ